VCLGARREIDILEKKSMSFPSASLPRNRFKAALRAGQRQIGLWSGLCSNIASEIIAGAGFDWVVIDTEHAPNEVPGLLSQLQAMTNGTAEPVVRCAWNDAVLIKRILDVGARSLLVPFVQNAEEARRAVAATRYPPLGVRGVSVAPRANLYGRVAGYHHVAHESTCVLVQVETRAALGEIESIAAVEGIDGIFIGPSDLAADFGYLANPRHPEVQAAIADGCARIRGTGIAAGILTGDPDEGLRYLDLGFTFVAVGSDVGILARGSEKLAAQCKERAAAPSKPVLSGPAESPAVDGAGNAR
jgi:2-keto-3-deoxy-L-rhamnonate aldolase RhmA